MVQVKLVVHFEDNTWWAESPTLEGFTVVAPTLRELRVLAREAAAFHLEIDEDVQLLETMPEGHTSARLPDLNTAATGAGRFATHRQVVRVMAPA